MVSRSELYRECVGRLEEAGIPDSGFDMMCIFQDMLGDRNPLFRPLDTVPDDAEMRIRQLTERRCKGEPLQYLLGEWEFWGYPFRVGEGVLIPRPDTETLIEDVLGICRRNGLVSPKIADLCSGSGCIAVTLGKELPRADVCAVELSEAALPYLRDNIKRNNADVRVIAADVLSEQTRQLVGELDLIVSNPPYLTADEMTELSPEVLREPSMALYGGADGLDFYRAITCMWKKSLKKGGFMCYEFGMDQHEAVGRILSENGFTDMKFSRDGGGIIRTVSARYIG